MVKARCYGINIRRIVIGPLRKFTAVIGPNGSGKSNLMDAISFVLGEPTKSLRVRKLSELIHGAPIGKPIGTKASVTLVFVLIKKARDGSLTEIEKRFQRVINGNASDYRVDNQQYSHGEYQEELENMGIIPKAKNFLVFQGQVESIAMKTPKEFTAMFEELSRSGELKEEYEQLKTEKNKAEQDTHANFQKKKGIEKQKKEVRLEKEEAQKYENLKKQFDDTQLQLKLFQLYYNRQELMEVRERCKEKEQDVAKNQRKKEKTDEESKTKKKELATLTKDLTGHEQRIKELETQVNKQRPAYIKAKENSTHHEKKYEYSKKNLIEAEKAHAAHDSEIEKYQQDLEEVKCLAQDYEAEIADASQSLGKDLQLEENQMKEYRRLKEEAGKKMVKFIEEYDSVDREQKFDKTNLEQEERRKLDHVAKIQQTEAKLEELNTKIEKLNTYIQELEREYNEKQASSVQLEKEVAEGKQRSHELEDQISRINNEMGEARVDRHETSRAQRKAELMENLKQFNGVVAITKVLGRNMDAIIVERETTVQSCLRYMKEHRYEPETFLPLDYIKVTPVNEKLRELQEPKNVKLVLDVIKYDKQFYKALLYACGNSLVCESDEDARRLAYEGGEKYKVVSLDGTLFSRSGVISGGSSELKARAKRWDEKHLEGLRMQKDKLFEELKEQNKKRRREAELNNSRAQLQQLESRLRYSKGDKDACEKKQRQLIEDDLIKFREKLAEFDPKIKTLQERMEERGKTVKKLRDAKNKVEDEIFVDFCHQIKVKNIRVYEERELLVAEQRAQKRLEFENQKSKIQTMLDYERSRDTQGYCDKIRTEVENLEKDLKKYKTDEKKHKKVIDDLQNEIEEMKETIADLKKQSEIKEIEIQDCQKRVNQSNREFNESKKRLQLIEADIEKLKMERHNYYRIAKLDEILIPFRVGSMDEISTQETGSSDDTTIQNGSQNTQNAHSSSQSNSTLIASQEETKEIYETEDGFEVNFKKLKDEYKHYDSDKVDKHEKEIIKQLQEIEIQLQKQLPPTTSIDNKIRNVKTTFDATNAEFERARNHAKKARQNFERVKKERYDRFSSLYEHVSNCIDEIYKQLTNSQAAVACFTIENGEEPYLGGITYNCVAPGKRFQAMENLSGGEKTVAAIALMFALRSFKPAPFFLLDEVDAALDNTNIGKVADFIREQSQQEFQCLVISLKEQFFSRSDALVGIYPEPGDCITSHCLTLDLNQFDDRENISAARG
ncbi:unnamed protein product [Didymodactylos carnosus]|uniref:Structural maintenance of chromosomes protein n=1 Tax=Didymodactylos carnosus TaxID=1234261 RepID=A0A813WUS6_9BILA|nr:unnamed protein product [Didymodactylos carnosus]CAF0930812.1 unnamed protein product [Didymodactylos carnosus]CAF3643478.1 unnamed protein product [Didymodactylos carnosus]CAF3707402.1 unnamed protein product [Didymodactylos carnosus]